MYVADDPLVYNNKVCGQYNVAGTAATVTNLLIYLHDYNAYYHIFKCSVHLTGAIGSKSEDCYIGPDCLYIFTHVP